MVQSLAGLIARGALTRERPFRAPHHSASMAALTGGGVRVKPGEVSLAHNGVLFLDELPEFSPQALDSLRQPLETGEVIVARANAHVRYPARVQLVAALNPLLGMGDGAFVDLLLAAVHEPSSTEPTRWDVALVSYVGYWTHYDQRVCASSWPLPATADADELVQFAAVSGATRERPLADDIYMYAVAADGTLREVWRGDRGRAARQVADR